MHVLITGGAGFLGSSLCARLLDNGHSVIAVDNLLTGDIANLETFKKHEKFQFFECGVEQQTFLDFCAQQKTSFDRVYHLACATGVPNIETLGEEMLLACSIGTWNVLDVARKSNAQVLFTSSSEVYGEPLVTPQSEEYTGNVETTGFRSNYEEGKRFSETIVAHFVRKYNLRAVMVRLFNAYGPNMSLKDTRVIPTFSMQALNDSPITVQGDGSQLRTMCFVSDILDGFEIVISKGSPGEIYNLGSDVEISMKELALTIKEMLASSSAINFVKRPSHDHSRRMPSLDKLRALGWNLKVDLKTGLTITIEGFKKRLVAQDYFSKKKTHTIA